MIFSTVLLVVFSFVGRVAVARAYSVGDWGLFNLGLSLTGVLSIGGLLGVHQAMARTLSFETDPGRRRAAVRWGLSVSIASAITLSTVVFVLAAPLAQIFSPSRGGALTSVFQLLAATVGFVLLATSLASIFQGFEDARPNAWYNQVLAPGLFVVFVLFFLALHLPFVWTLVAYALANGLAFAAIAFHAWRKLPRRLPRPAGPRSRPPRGLATLSISLWGVASLTFVTTFVDTLILGVFRPPSSVGLYSAGITLARLLLAGAAALTYIYLPVVARLTRSGNRDDIRSSYVTATRWIVLVTFPLFLLFALLPGLCLAAVFGRSYAGGATALAIIAWGSFLSTAVGPSAATLAGVGHARTLLVVTILSASVNVATSFALIPSLGLVGAAIAWTTARFVYSLGGAYALWRTDRVTSFRTHFTLPLSVAMAVGLPVFYILGRLGLVFWTLIPLFVLGGMFFVFATLLTRSLDPGDLVALGAIERLFGKRLPTLRRWMIRLMRSSAPSRVIAQ
jgi:O-antigen/teichoic acid export membrane protein